MSKRILVIPDQHAHPEYPNDRADWLGRFIVDCRPDIVVNIGDGADMASLCSYDKGKKSFQGRTYSKDIDSHTDFQERCWSTVRRGKKKLPRRIYLIGNHEERISRAVELQPELEGVIGYSDLALDEWYDTIVHYSGGTPGTIEVEGISFSHYSVGGIAARPISGEHHAYSLLAKNHSSTVVGHSHTFDYCMRTRADGTKIIGVVAGCYQDYDSGYAGDAGRYWYRGLVVLDGVEKGVFDVRTISLSRLKEEYGK
jgi:hypothetical protein